MDRDRSLAALGLVLTLTLAGAGCVGREGNGDGARNGTTTTGMTTYLQVDGRPAGPWASIQMDCEFRQVVVYLPASDVDEHLPAGYKSVGLLPGTATVMVEIHQCPAVIFDNETVLKDVSWSGTWVFVTLPAIYRERGVVNAYLLETFSDTPLLVEALRTAGLPTALAEIRIDNGPAGTEIEIRSSGESVYTFLQMGPPGDMDLPSNSRARLHVESDGGHRWMTLERDYAFERIQRQAAMDIGAGAIGRFAAGALGYMTGFTSVGTENGRLYLNDPIGGRDDQ